MNNAMFSLSPLMEKKVKCLLGRLKAKLQLQAVPLIV